MNRADFQRLAQLRLDEASLLLESGCYAGAYYLIGYVVECALKACISTQTQEHDFPLKGSDKLYTHDLNNLLKFTGLSKKHEDYSDENPDFKLNWTIVKDWKEESRYSLVIDKDQAQALHAAVTDGKDGVFPWLQKLW